MNLFVTKQIKLVGLDVTASDAIAVGYLLGLSLIQEYFGTQAARQHVWISFLCSLGFLGLSYLHLFFTPNQFDMMHPHFDAILSPMPRLIIASLFSFFLIQLVDIAFFQYLRSKTKGRWLTGRAGFCLLISQGLDTVVFSYAGLYGLVENLGDVMVVSFLIKLAVIGLSLPYVAFSKKFGRYLERPLNKKPQALGLGI